MKIINFYGGPGAGKTALAFELFTLLKKKGAIVEIALEFATKLINENRSHILRDNQSYVMINQYQSLYDFKHRGDVEFVVTDSPVLMQSAYFNPATQDVPKAVFDAMSASLHDSFDNMEIFIRRDPNRRYEQRGRIHTAAQAGMLDLKILDLLENREHRVFDPEREDAAAFAGRLSDELVPPDAARMWF